MTRRLRSGVIALAMLACGACESERIGPAPTPPAVTPQQPPPPAPPAPPPAPRPITDDVTGDYTLTLYVGSTCSVIQEAERTRTYTATITSPIQANYVVTLTSGKFLEGRICTNNVTGLSCNQFAAQRTGDLIQFDLANNNDDGVGGHIVEQLSSGPWVEIMGSAVGPVKGSTIYASGSSSIYYCPFQPPGTPCCPIPGPPGVPCPIASSSCQSGDMTLSLMRK